MLNAITLNLDTTNWATNFTLDVRDEAGTWHTIKNVTNGNPAIQHFTFYPPAIGHALRVNVTAENDGGNAPHAIREVEIYGTLFQPNSTYLPIVFRD